MVYEFTNVKNLSSGRVLAIDIDDEYFSYYSGDGDNLTTTPYKVKIDNEIIKVVTQTGDDVTVCVRGQENTTPAIHLDGAIARINIFAGDIEELQDAVNDLAANPSGGGISEEDSLIYSLIF